MKSFFDQLVSKEKSWIDVAREMAERIYNTGNPDLAKEERNFKSSYIAGFLDGAMYRAREDDARRRALEQDQIAATRNEEEKSKEGD